MDGRITAAAQEERFVRKRNSSVFPANAANYCLQEGGISVYDVDFTVFYEKPYLKFHRAVLSHIRDYPFTLKSFIDTMPSWLEEKLTVPLRVAEDIAFEGETLFAEHHLSHAASAFFASPFDEAAILTADGAGEWVTLSCYVGRGSSIEALREIHYPHSLGLLFTAAASYLGFDGPGGEDKVAALAGEGQPAYLEAFRRIVEVAPDGSYRISPGFFMFSRPYRMYTGKLVRLLGPARKAKDPITEKHRNIAASLQKFMEETIVLIAKDLKRLTGKDNLCLGGGVFLNCALNRKVKEEGGFREVFISPAAGDAGGALGAAYYAHHSLLGKPRKGGLPDVYLGPSFSESRIKSSFMRQAIDFREMDDEVLLPYIAAKIMKGKTVGWFRGRMEFGPSALGNRSILARANDAGTRDLLNLKIKKREGFIPCASAVLEERAGDYFKISGPSPFMTVSAETTEEKKLSISGAVHTDGTARPQTVSEGANAGLRGVIKEIEKSGNPPIVLNTSMNLSGEPVACYPEDAVDLFMKSGMDCLVMGNCVAEKHRQ